MTAVTEILDLAKSFVNDDHSQTEGWASPETWLLWANRAWKNLHPQLVRKGILDIDTGLAAFAAPVTTITNAAAIVLVYEEDSSNEHRRLLKPSQDTLGVYYQALDSYISDGITWAAARSAYTNGMTVVLNPTPGDGTYRIVYIENPLTLVETGAVPGTSSDVLSLPGPVEERVALQIAKYALVRARGRSQALQELINEADIEVTLWAASQRGGGNPRIMNQDWLYRGWAQRGQDAGIMNPNSWWWK